jgi:hypothetical protein
VHDPDEVDDEDDEAEDSVIDDDDRGEAGGELLKVYVIHICSYRNRYHLSGLVTIKNTDYVTIPIAIYQRDQNLTLNAN